MNAKPLHAPPHGSLRPARLAGPASTRGEALSAVARYARLAAFAAACALYVLVRYVVLRPARERRRVTSR